MVGRFIVGVMGGGEGASEEDCRVAYRLGTLIAQEGWVLLGGGRPWGIMEASARGAREQGGLTVGILPGRTRADACDYIDIPIVTNMGDGRNSINVLSSDVVVALSGQAGTISEIALALKNGRRVILLNFDVGSLFDLYRRQGLLFSAGNPEETIALIRSWRGE